MMPVMDESRSRPIAGDPSLPTVQSLMSANIASTGGHHPKDILLYLKKPLGIDRLLGRSPSGAADAPGWNSPDARWEAHIEA
jgi:hypothetical protein